MPFYKSLLIKEWVDRSTVISHREWKISCQFNKGFYYVEERKAFRIPESDGDGWKMRGLDTNIGDFKQDFAFLKKFETQLWGGSRLESDESSAAQRKNSNFELHPDRITRDSFCLSPQASPKKLPAGAVDEVVQTEDVHNNEIDNDFNEKNSSAELLQVEDDEIPYFEADFENPPSKWRDKAEDTHKFVLPLNQIGSATKMQKIVQNSKPSPPKRDFFNKKFQILVEKNIKILGEIRDVIKRGITPPDGEEDYERRLRRVQEFSSRFSRIYLYPSVRLTNELSLPDKLTCAAVNQKILCAHQTILQGLQAYYNHLPSSVGQCASDKLKSLLEQATYLCQIHGLLKTSPRGENDEFVNALRTHIELLEEVIKNNNLKCELPPRPRPAPFGEKRSKTCTAPMMKKPKLQKKLSMYNETASFRKDLLWKKTVESLAKKKFQVKSRYKTATFKHRPPMEKPPLVITLPSKSKLGFKRSSGALKCTPLTTPINEDDIKTMVQMNGGLEASNNNMERLSHVDIAAKLLQLVRDKDRRQGDGNCASANSNNPLIGTTTANTPFNDPVNYEEVRNVAEILRQSFKDQKPEDVEVFIQRILTEIGKRNMNSSVEILGSSNELAFVEMKKSEGDVSRRERKETVISVTGPKNARLICIKDESSVIEEVEEVKADKEIMTDKEIVRASSATQTDVSAAAVPTTKKKAGKPKQKKFGIKISRLPKTHLKQLEILPKNEAVSIIQYKLENHRYLKQNPMYRRCCNVQPWVIMGRISDTILDDLLLSLAKELEVNDILENLYQAEFQY